MREVLGDFLKLKSSGEGVPDASSQSRSSLRLSCVAHLLEIACGA
jgi:hypothetical protein